MQLKMYEKLASFTGTIARLAERILIYSDDPDNVVIVNHAKKHLVEAIGIVGLIYHGNNLPRHTARHDLFILIEQCFGNVESTLDCCDIEWPDEETPEWKKF